MSPDSDKPSSDAGKASRFAIVDVETRSQRDLKKTGVWCYAADPTTDTWCVGYAINDDPAGVWRPGDSMPAALLTAMYDPKTVFVAHNAAFERAIFKHIL